MVTPQNQAGSPESDVFSLPAWRSYFRGDDRELGRRYLTVLLSIGGVLSVAALAGITWDARWTRVWSALVHADWPYILIAPVGVAVSHLGYTLAYRQVARTADGPDLTYKKAAALVTTGFGPLSPKGGFALDTQEFRKLGFTEEEAQLRVRT